MTRRLLLFQCLLLAGLSTVFLLPRTPPIRDAALVTELPNYLTLSGWTGQPFGKPTVEEKSILAKDTAFFRRDYYREVPPSEQQRDAEAAVAAGRKPPPFYAGLTDVLNASIVLSGKDLSNSIHALERCLTAQGYNIPSASTMKVTLRTGQVLPVRRLICEKAEPESKRLIRSIAYYWFTGHDYVTSNHVRRGLRDFMDRILHGYDQRWAYITVTARLDSGPLYLPARGDREPEPARDSTGSVLIHRALTEENADAMAAEFIGDIGPDIIKVEQIREWPKE